jgi:two-component sensor histidine kinase
LSSVNIPILMLSGDLRIRRFTPMAEPLFNLIPTDVGRPFSNIQHNLQLPNLGLLAIGVIDTLHTHEQEVQDTHGHWYSLRIRPYRTIDNQIDGAVINLIDIDVLKRHAALIEQSRDYATAIGDEKAILLRELRHRVKNNLQVISSLLSLQSSRTTDATAIQILQDSQNRVQTIALMHEVLHRSPNLAALNFAEYVKLLVSYVFSSGNLQPEAIAPAVDVPADLPIHPDQAVLCGLIINELVTNALKYGAPPAPDAASPSVAVQITLIDRQLSLAVSNAGDTLPTDFDLAALPTIGLKLVTNLVEQLNGTLQIDRGQQTTFKICFNLEEQRLK